MDSYPEIMKKRKGRPSPWFESYIAGMQHNGLQMLLRICSVQYDNYTETWYEPAEDNKNSSSIKTTAFWIGIIPYEWIVDVDWDGNDIYNIPHIYCRFSNKKNEPYVKKVICTCSMPPYKREYIELCRPRRPSRSWH